MKVKIKNNEELIDATIEMVDGVMVVSPKEVKWEPKDGDVVVCDDGGIQIFICKENLGDSIYSYCMYNAEDNELTFYENIRYMINRPATEEEKQKLFDKLAEEGWEWDADKKQIVKLKWKPKRFEYYYAPFCNGVIFEPCEYQSVDTVFDNLRYDKSWVFKTIQECQAFCDRLNKAIEEVKP